MDAGKISPKAIRSPDLPDRNELTKYFKLSKPILIFREN